MPDGIGQISNLDTAERDTLLTLHMDSDCTRLVADVSRSDGTMRTTENNFDGAHYVHSAPPASSMQCRRNTSTESPSPRTFTAQRSTPSTQTSLATTVYTNSPLTGSNSPSVITAMVRLAARNFLRDDYIHFLEAELPRWKAEPLWHHTQVFNSAVGVSAYRELELAYSSVCQLDTRMGDDAIRNRMALVRLHSEYIKACQQHDKNLHTQPSVEEALASLLMPF